MRCIHTKSILHAFFASLAPCAEQARWGASACAQGCRMLAARYSRCWTAETRGPRSARRTWCGSRNTGGRSRPRTWSCGKSRRSEHRPCALPDSAALPPLFSSLVLYSFQTVDAVSCTEEKMAALSRRMSWKKSQHHFFLTEEASSYLN